MFFVDKDNNRVGIGTSSPQEKLSVTGDVNVSGKLISTQSTGDWAGWFENTNTTGAGVYIKGTSTSASDSLFHVITEGSSGILDVQADGKIGIGTKTPSHLLNVIGDVNITGNSIVEKLTFENDASHYMEDNSTCVKIYGSTSILEIC